MKHKITYATVATPTEELQAAMDAAIERVRSTQLGAEAPMFLDGRQVRSEGKFERVVPFDTDLRVCTAQKGTAEHARRALQAARAAFSDWRHVPWFERVEALRRIADELEANSFERAALMVFEVGKSRMEALAEVAETIELLRYYADSVERSNGFIHEMGKLNPEDPTEHNVSVLRPFGAWVVISPFNFPLALSAAPIAAALVTGNTVVFKGSSDTPYTAWRAAELFATADLPPGVFNYVSGPGSVVGRELQENPVVDGWTFTGSYDVGMGIARQAVGGPYPRPAIVEMGGKNPAIISNAADVEKAVTGVVRAAFGLGGQKCSACSRVYVQADVYEAFKERLVAETRALVIGDPTRRDTFMGPLVNAHAQEQFLDYAGQASAGGEILTGGHVLDEGELADGYYVAPTIVEGLAEDHPLVKQELFVPLLHLARVDTLEEGMAKANDTLYGLTAGFYSQDEREVAWFFDHIQAGTTYANREGGATTGAWPGVQPFGGWKGSGSSGKNIGGLYSLLMYMREQSQTTIGFE